MNICVRTCNRAEMARRLVVGLKPHLVTLLVNNCDTSPYRQISDRNCQKLMLDIHGDPLKCSNRAFCYAINNAKEGEDLLVIDDDTEPCCDFVGKLKRRASALHRVTAEYSRGCFTMNPLYTPARHEHTKYTPLTESQISVAGFKFIRSNWVDDNIFIPAALICEFKKWYATAPKTRANSNGTGYYHSRRMFQKGYPMFTCVPSLLGHGDHLSIIHPQDRKKYPLIAITHTT